MSKSHQKKRNAGLMYEFLVSSISRALVEDDKRRSAAALRVIKKHFKPGSELYKEFRLINSLMKTNVSNHTVAANILQEAKRAARSHDYAALDREKSLLIRSINHGLKDDMFYDSAIKEYRMYATLQTLINDWRSATPDLERMARYEDQVVTWLTSERDSAATPGVLDESPGTNRLLMKVMMKKLNEKYNGVLSPMQKEIVRSYAWSTTHDSNKMITEQLKSVQHTLVGAISEYIDTHPVEKALITKLTTTREKLLAENVDSVDDATVTRFMLYSKLDSELKSEDE